MLTQCPNCQTTFRVTSEILRVAAGQVRCGRCQAQFDALARMLEEPDAGEVQSGRFLRPPRTPSTPAEDAARIEVEEPDAQEDITLEGRKISISGVYRTVDENGRSTQEVREEITDEWDDEQAQSSSEESGIEVVESDVEEIAAEERQHDEPQSGEAPAADADLDLLATPARKPSSRGWTIGAPLLALLFLMQAVHHYRAELARHPTLGAPLTSIYGALGLTLTPDWDLHAYEIRQWGVVSDPAQPGSLKVRASVTNLASFAQPYPLLKLVLEDRWGDQVRARAFTPTEYLDPATAADRMLGPSQQANATIVIIDPGPDAEGFRFDVCLPGRHGEVCAEDVPSA